MEVVLADGEVLRTGMGGVENSTAWQAYRWGYGPWVDGLFLQSNLGVVTKIGIWLMKRPPAHMFFIAPYPDIDTAARGVEVMRDLRLHNVLETGIVGETSYVLAGTVRRSEIYEGDGPIPEDVYADFLKARNMPYFAGLSVLYGTEERIAADFKTVQAAFDTIGVRLITSGPMLSAPGIEHWHMNMVGEPSIAEFGNYNFRGGGGSMWFAPVVPARAEDVKRAYGLIRPILREHGFDMASGFLVYGRHLDMIVDLLFDRTDPDEMKRAYACFDECLTACTNAGYGLYRTNIAFMEKAADAYGPAQKAMNKRLKRALDPNGIIAPGKSGIYV